MPKLTREKVQSIVNTFAKRKQYASVAKIENVDPRTVKKIVASQSDKDNVPAQPPLAISQPRQQIRGEDGSSRVLENSEKEIQLDANGLFEQGFNNLSVSKKLRLLPRDVMRYRKEYNQMIQGDVADAIEKQRIKLEEIERTIQDRRTILKKCETQLEQSLGAIYEARAYRAFLTNEMKTLEYRKEQCELECRYLEKKTATVRENILRVRGQRNRVWSRERNIVRFPPDKGTAKIISALQEAKIISPFLSSRTSHQAA